MTKCNYNKIVSTRLFGLFILLCDSVFANGDVIICDSFSGHGPYTSLRLAWILLLCEAGLHLIKTRRPCRLLLFLRDTTLGESVIVIFF